jgi:CHAD domain-containing protein
MGKAKHDGERSIGSALGTLALKECRTLQQALTTRKELQDGIHRARRACRKLRSLLALLEQSSDRQHVETLHKSLRQLVHSFSDLRDAHIAIRTARLLAGSHATTLKPALIAQLESRSMELLNAALEQDPEWQRRSRKATRIAIAVETLNWHNMSSSSAKRALKHSVKRMKKARRAALEQHSDTAFHRWRRRARQVRYQLEFLHKAQRMTGTKKSYTDKYAKRAKQLGLITDRLGWRQDFQVFLATLDSLSDSAEVRALREALSRKSARLSKMTAIKRKNASADAQATPQAAS